MDKPTRSIQWIVWSGLTLVILAIVVSFVTTRIGFRVQSEARALPVIGTVADFALTNQMGRVVTLADLRGQVWVADIIFTRCPGACAKMTREMSELQAALPAGDSVRLVSLTADPGFDTPDVLKRYGDEFGASPERWHFLTGRKPDLYKLATQGLLLAVGEKQSEQRESENDLFIHSTKFILIDQQGRIRGEYEATEPKSRGQILKAVQTLLTEK